MKRDCSTIGRCSGSQPHDCMFKSCYHLKEKKKEKDIVMMRYTDMVLNLFKNPTLVWIHACLLHVLSIPDAGPKKEFSPANYQLNLIFNKLFRNSFRIMT